MANPLGCHQFTEDTDLNSRTGPKRRDSDWGGHPRSNQEDLAWAAKRAAVSIAAATLHARDGCTGAHSDDVVRLCGAIADELGVHGHDRANLLAAAQLHDLGKVAIPDEVLEKPAPLDESEWALVRRHTVAGEEIVQSVPELRDVARLIRHSHERWDGGGYPDGLSGAQIPLASRIVFCADAFHAIRSDRPYRRGRAARDALNEVSRNAGSQFDPDVASALVKSAAHVRETVRIGGRDLGATFRSRRLVSLLLTLAIGGSAMAAGGAHIERSEPGAGQREAAAASRPATGAVQTGERETTRERSDRAGRGARAGDPARSGNAPGERSRQKGAITGKPVPGSATPAGPAHRRAPAPAAAPPQSSPATPTRRRVGRPDSPGRSDEAPGRPAQPGRPLGGAPGRSEQAPGRPDPEGRPPARPMTPSAGAESRPR